MRVLLAHPYTSWNGVRRGGERYLDDLLAHLVGVGHEVVVATATRHATRTYEHAGARVVELHVGEGAGRDERFGDAVRDLVAAQPPDVAHCFEAPAALGAAAVPTVFSVLGMPTAVWLADRPSYAHQLQAAAAVAAPCALSPAAAGAVEAAVGRPVRVLPPGLRGQDFPLATAPRDGRTVLFTSVVGERRKRYAELAEAVARVPYARLVVAAPPGGDAPPPAPRTQVLPDVGREDLPRLYGSASVTAVPSVDEAFGLVVVESLACGTPVLVAPGSGPAGIVGAEPAGVVAEPVGVVADDLAEGLDRLLRTGADPRACRDRALRWDWSVVGPQHEQLYAEVAEAGPERALGGR